MREYSTPPVPRPPAAGGMADDVVRLGLEDPDRVTFSRAVGDPGERSWQPVTSGRFLAEVRGVAKGLVAAGIAEGDRVLIFAGTSYAWTLADYALWHAGAVGVPVYETSSVEQAAWVLQDSGARAGFVGGSVQAARLREAAGGRPLPTWELSGGDPDQPLAALVAGGREVPDEEIERRRVAVGPQSVATVVYTSGTTGRPRGCELTHGNLDAELAAALHELPELFEGEDAATLLVLPLAHVLGRLHQVGAVRAGVRLGHVTDVRHLLRDLRDFHPTFVLGVPRVFEKVFNVASQQAAAEGRGRRFDRATEAAIAWSQAQDRLARPAPGSRRRRGPGPLLRVRHSLADRLVLASLREALGGRCRYAVCGGAPLGERLGHFYRGIGVPVLEGYGLTETSGAVTVNRPDALRVGTVGRPLPGTAVRVAVDGELLVRGGQVMRGYRGDPDATRAALSPDGWLHTGDLGEIDEEGFVRVTGRRTEILVTSGGKNVAPGQLEDRIRAHPLVGQCLVVGDGRPYVAALVTLDPEPVAAWAALHGRKGSASALVDDPDLRAELQKAVDEANAAVSQAEWVRRWELLTTEWTEESGELTPSLRLRRNVVLRRYRAQIEALYD